jgi:hypothetical protein
LLSRSNLDILVDFAIHIALIYNEFKYS